jgi:predicted esterase
MGSQWVLSLFAIFTCAAAQTNAPALSQHFDLPVPLNPIAAREAANAGQRVASLKGSVDIPANFDVRRSWPVLLVCAPSGSSAVNSARAYTNIALAQGWIVVAIDGPKVSVQQDNNVFAWAMIQSLLNELRRNWPQSKQWPFAVAGFSGGAKRSAMIAAEMMRQGDSVIGVFMGGCNEDRATLGYQISNPGAGFLNLPMFLSNGTRDAIAGPSHAQTVRLSMEQTGFRKIRAETYNEGHKLDTNHLAMALEWFRPVPKVQPKRAATTPLPK